MLAYIAEIDRRRLYLEHACPSMFAFCTGRFHMSEAVAARRIRAGRATCRFPCILGMVARGELHLSGIHQLAGHLTDENHEEVLRRAKHKSMREIERLVAEVSPKPDVRSSIRALPVRRAQGPMRTSEGGDVRESPEKRNFPVETSHTNTSGMQASDPVADSPKPKSSTTPLSPRRYKLQVTIGQEARDKLAELQDLLSHQIPDGDAAAVIERALDALLSETKKKKAALTDRPRSRVTTATKKTRAIPARVRREVFERDAGQCRFVDCEGRRCESTWKVEFHHRVPYARGGSHSADNIQLRCRAHNQYEAELEYGELFIVRRRRSASLDPPAG
jgi:5-methylcytosine-specific restriction endonuclease McrA